MTHLITTALLTRASDNGFDIVQAGKHYNITQGKRLFAFHSDPSKALDLAIDRKTKADAEKAKKAAPGGASDDLEIPPFLRRQHAERTDKPANGSEVHPNSHTTKVDTPAMAAATAPKIEEPAPNVKMPERKKKPVRGAAKGTAAKAPVAAPVVETPKADGPIKGSIIKDKYKQRYKKNGDYSCGDDVADELKAFITTTKDGRVFVDLSKLKKVAVDNGVWKDRYGNLNAGQMRMTVGNCLRAKLNNGEDINIDGVVLNKNTKDGRRKAKKTA